MSEPVIYYSTYSKSGKYTKKLNVPHQVVKKLELENKDTIEWQFAPNKEIIIRKKESNTIERN
jgi:antitoxin component of MazEF toxin-antitoxin module